VAFAGSVRKADNVNAVKESSPLLAIPRVRGEEVFFWLAVLAVAFAFSGQLAFATSVLIAMMFALSLNLILGYGGILTLGQGLHFGIGAYVAGILAIHGFQEPIVDVVLAGLASAAAALVLCRLIVRLSGLPLIMVTLSLAALGYETANKAGWLTGGDNGLQVFEFAPILGIFHWSVFGPQAYLYTLVWLFVLFVVVRITIASPFGVALQGIRENRQRMSLLGVPVTRHLLIAYGLSGFIAGAAGALSTETTKFVGLDSISVDRSVDVLLMTVLGGVGRMYGPLVGAPAYTIVHHFASEWNPYHWMFVIGVLLIVVVRFARGGVIGIIESLWHRIARREPAP
jgi:branched-chain amino acid transport system permease protein